jgi:hypothetical protein
VGHPTRPSVPLTTALALALFGLASRRFTRSRRARLAHS